MEGSPRPVTEALRRRLLRALEAAVQPAPFLTLHANPPRQRLSGTPRLVGTKQHTSKAYSSRRRPNRICWCHMTIFFPGHVTFVLSFLLSSLLLASFSYISNYISLFRGCLFRGLAFSSQPPSYIKSFLLTLRTGTGLPQATPPTSSHRSPLLASTPTTTTASPTEDTSPSPFAANNGMGGPATQTPVLFGSPHAMNTGRPR